MIPFKSKLQAPPLPIIALLVGIAISAALLLYFELQQRMLLTHEIEQALKTHDQLRAEHLDLTLQRAMADYQARIESTGRSQRMARHLQSGDWGGADEPSLHAPQAPPDWWSAAQWQGLVPPPHLALLDSNARVRELLTDDARGAQALFIEALGYFRRGQASPVVFPFQDRVHLALRGPLDTAEDGIVGYVVALVELDAEWVATVLGVAGAELVGPAPKLSSDAGSSGPKRTVQRLAQTRPEGGGPILYWRMSRSSRDVFGPLALLSRLERSDRIMIALVFVATLFVFAVGVTFWLRDMYGRVRSYSRQMLHMTPALGERGNQLQLLEGWIRSLINLVHEAEEARRSQHESEILRSEAVKSAVLDASLDSIITVDDAGMIIEFNPAAEITFGYAREEVMGQRFQTLLLRPASREMFNRQLSMVGKSADRRVIPRLHDLQAVARHGRVLEVELALQPMAVRDEALYAVYLRDITERRKQEAEIRNLAAFPSESPMPVMRINRPGVVVYANSQSEPLLAHWGCLRLQTLPFYWRQQIQNVLQTGTAREVEIGTEQGLYSLLLSPNPDQGYVNVYGRDITEIRRAEDEARRRQNELVHVARLSTMGEMATGIAHELNQPLSAIVNFANGCVRRLKLGVGGTEDLLHALGQISAQANRAGEIIKRLRNMVGKQQPVREMLDLNQLVREVCQLISHEANQQGIVIEQSLSRIPLMVRVDGVQIEQVLLNVVRNAMDALEINAIEEPFVRIMSGRTVNDQAYVAIEDNGPGIPPKVKEHLFDPFFTTKETGMGMGLAISQTIVAEHNGRMYADSWPGRGAVFTMELPAAMKRTESVASI